MPGAFDLKTQLPDSDEEERVTWRVLKQRRLQRIIENYKLPVTEVDGDISDIIELFVRINSTGKALTSQERRHARFFRSDAMRLAGRIGKRFEKRFIENKIFSTGQLSRMKHIELICDLMFSLLQGRPLNKKSTLDRLMEQRTIDGRQLRKAERTVISALNRTLTMFPQLKTTRFCKGSDFYTLCLLIGKYEQEGLVLSDAGRNALAWDLLRKFSLGVDEVCRAHQALKND